MDKSRKETSHNRVITVMGNWINLQNACWIMQRVNFKNKHFYLGYVIGTRALCGKMCLITGNLSIQIVKVVTVISPNMKIIIIVSFCVCLGGLLKAQPSKRSFPMEEWEKVRIGAPSDSTDRLIDEITVKSTSYFINEDSNQYRALQKAIVKIKKAAVSMGGDFVEIKEKEILPMDDYVSGNGISVHPLVSQKTLFKPGSYASTEFQLLLTGQNGAKGTPLYSDIKGKLAKSDPDAVWAYYVQPYYRPYGYYGMSNAYRFPHIIVKGSPNPPTTENGLMYSQRVDVNNVLDGDLGYKCIISARIFKSKSSTDKFQIQELIEQVNQANDIFAIASKWKVTRSGSIQPLPFDAQTFSIDNYETENGDAYVYLDLRRDPAHKFKVDSYDNQKMLLSYRHGHAIYYLLALKH